MGSDFGFSHTRRLAFKFIGAGLLFTITLAAVFLFGPRESPSTFLLFRPPPLTDAATYVCYTFAGLAFVCFLAPAILVYRPSTPQTRVQQIELLALGAIGVSAFVTTLGFVTLFSRGRQLRRRGSVLLPELESSDDWSKIQVRKTVHPNALVASAWRENGRTEYASVAAFAQLTLDLMSLGAPPRLLADAQQDALDEIRHAQRCFSLAQSFDGNALSPAPFPQAQKTRSLPPTRTLALCRVAIDSLLEGALLEGYSARVIARLVLSCQHAPTVEVLKELAADEGRHSRHGWDVLEWCLEEGGLSVAQALRGASLGLPSETNETRSGWTESECHGIPSAALEREVYAEVLKYTQQRIELMTARFFQSDAA
jgi:hypothetical protein